MSRAKTKAATIETHFRNLIPPCFYHTATPTINPHENNSRIGSP